MNHTFTIVVILYNSEKYIEKCVNSILSQTYINFELLLVDDGSQDSTLEKCYFFQKKDSRVKVIHQANSGISGARNTGIKNARGGYITFVDGDDWLDKNYLKSMNDLLMKNQNTDCILGRMTEYTEETENFVILGDSFDQNINALFDKNDTGKDFFTKIIKQYGRFPMGMGARGIYRLEMLKENKVFFRNKYYEDIDFTFNAIYHSKKVLCNPFPYYYFRNHSTSTSKKVQISYAYDIIDLMKSWKRCAETDDNKNFSETLSKELARRYMNMILKYSANLPNEGFYLLIDAVRDTKYLLNKGTSVRCRLIKTILKLFGVKLSLKFYRTMYQYRHPLYILNKRKKDCHKN